MTYTHHLTTTGRASSRYQQVQNEAVDHRDLVVLLFEGAARFLQDGCRYLRVRDYERWAHCSNQVRRVLSELTLALDDSAAPDLCRSLKALYVYIQRIVTEGGLEEDMDKLQEAISLLTQLAAAWREAKNTCQKQNAKQTA